MTDLRFQLSEFNPWVGKWAALSQYGYAFAYFSTQDEAERYVREFYDARPHLINQFK